MKKYSVNLFLGMLLISAINSFATVTTLLLNKPVVMHFDQSSNSLVIPNYASGGPGIYSIEVTPLIPTENLPAYIGDITYTYVISSSDGVRGAWPRITYYYDGSAAMDSKYFRVASLSPTVQFDAWVVARRLARNY